MKARATADKAAAEIPSLVRIMGRLPFPVQQLTGDGCPLPQFCGRGVTRSSLTVDFSCSMHGI
jgi:hypothetical protein